MKLLSKEFLDKYKGLQPRNAGPLFNVVYLRTYSRWLEDKQRREVWGETIERVVEYSLSLYKGPSPHDSLVQEAELMFDKLFNLEVLPAGRTLWVGGTESSRKFGESQFNCSFTSINRVGAFGDLFQLLLCGCGVGFRVLEKDVQQLPTFATDIQIINKNYEPLSPLVRKDDTNVVEDWCNPGKEFTISIGDSREGWVKALREFLHIVTEDIHHSKTIHIDYDNIRPEGSRIKTFGGFAPGPKGLMEMFTNIAEVINSSNGNLSPVNCMDICNFLGKNVIVGGTRRSSQIALGGPADQEFIDAKKGLWLTRQNLQRTMSNNSVVFEEDPTLEQIKEIFHGIKNNGEPGFFNLKAAKRRRPNVEGLNPCITLDTWINTSKGPRQVKDLRDFMFHASFNGELYKATAFWSSGVKPVYRLKTVQGYELKLTKDHKIHTSNRGWVEAGNLTKEDKITLNKDKQAVWEGDGTFKEGWLLGSLVGDGTYESDTSACMRFWGESRHRMAEQAFQYMDESVEHSSQCKVVSNNHGNYKEVGCKGLALLAANFGIYKGGKVVITPEIEKASTDFYMGFLQGLFDADGSPQGNKEKGRSIRLTQANYEFLQGVQRMLLRLGINSTLYRNRREAGYRSLPDGKGGNKDFLCKALHELIISRDSMYTFAERVGFSEPEKVSKVSGFISDSNTRNLYVDRFEATLDTFEYIGDEEVFDCTVDTVHRFDANGIIAHNCAEILLADKAFCNLTTVNLMSFVADKSFDMQEAERSIRLAARIGTRMTNVTVSLPDWDEVQKRDRLLGVSLTGIMDAFDSLGIEFDSPEAVEILENLRKAANEEARNYSFEMRIPCPLLVTTLKPEGTLSQLPTVSSGLHRAYAPYYLRRIRMSSMDPTCKALQELGVPNEPDQGKAERVVFSFPIKTSANISAAEEPAKRQFERYLTIMKHYVDHNASCTLTIGESEWEEMEKMVFDNFDNVIACAFLSKYTSAYPQMPYEEITKEAYEELKSSFPDLTELTTLVNIYETKEFEDELESDCSSGVCPIR